ncbi:CAZyme family CBM63 [Penicillium roqueforti]|uniref:CAZyme family CBM63 n=1 Tax=Penicillium roqueforti TaxID=5082 RepID=UPI00190BEDF1|nr:CAZyme family CBM63 [Penicillium roqueforti]KAF9250456.1 CAZyme family CBM63 [Penicillium roqueforti]KAI2671542.1 CAZyme family CBM63 [Penicillium roqueforti]KAI3147112.1 CAZyme family CBM63 [Penicillium roqueforti]KAI3159504.1 CAZyme family CBM63 [Penicillium roqueforti]
MKYLQLASVAALLGAATVSAGPLRAREHDGFCPKGYTMSVYYKTITVDTYSSATSVETTVTPTATPVSVESQSSADPTVASSSTAVAVVSSTPVAVVSVETTTSSASATPVVPVETTSSSASAAETAFIQKAASKTDSVVATASTETAAVVQTIAAPVVKSIAAQTSTTQAAVEATSTSTSSIISSSTTTSSATTSSTTSSSTTSSAASSSTTSSSAISVSLGASIAGEATFYGGNVGGGTCSFSGYTLPSNLFGTALSLQRWDDAANCGTCVSVTGPSGNSITAMIVDQCPECESDHLDLFHEAFAELADTSLGVIETTWSYVSCDLDGPLQLKNKDGTGPYWFSMQVVNANEAVTALDVSTDGGSTWQGTTRTYYNFFEYDAGFRTSTVDVRVTGASGNTVIVQDVAVVSGTSVTAASNL